MDLNKLDEEKRVLEEKLNKAKIALNEIESTYSKEFQQLEREKKNLLDELKLTQHAKSEFEQKLLKEV